MSLALEGGFLTIGLLVSPLLNNFLYVFGLRLIFIFIKVPGGSVVKNPGSVVKNPSTNTQERGDLGSSSLGGEDPLKKEMATHSSILSWEIPWTEEATVSPRGHKELDTTKYAHTSRLEGSS